MKTLHVTSPVWAAVLLLIAGVFTAACSSTKEGPPADQSPKPEFQAALELPGFDEVMDREWVLSQIQTSAGPTEFSREALEAQDMGDYYTLRFDAERLSGKGAPNRYTAPYQRGESAAISIQAIAGTLMASFREPPGLGEREYFGYLERVSRWGLQNNVLNLYTSNPAGESLVLVYRLRQE
jgi:heat shock protein HslJ